MNDTAAVAILRRCRSRSITTACVGEEIWVAAAKGGVTMAICCGKSTDTLPAMTGPPAPDTKVAIVAASDLAMTLWRAARYNSANPIIIDACGDGVWARRGQARWRIYGRPPTVLQKGHVSMTAKQARAISDLLYWSEADGPAVIGTAGDDTIVVESQWRYGPVVAWATKWPLSPPAGRSRGRRGGSEGV